MRGLIGDCHSSLEKRGELPANSTKSNGVRRIFLLSPAKVNGVRARLLLNPVAPFALARQFREQGLSLADIFTFASGLYFRGKITYARRFARRGDLIRIITSNAGLLAPETHFNPDGLRAFGEVDISADHAGFHVPVRRDAISLVRKLHPKGSAILLGSIATGKYRDVLLDVFGPRLVFPSDFVGRGDMSRGGLLLRVAQSGTELPYTAVEGAVLRGRRPPRLGA